MSAPDIPTWLEGFMMKLKAAGTPEDTLSLIVEEIRRTQSRDAEYRCAACARSASAIMQIENEEGTVVYASPSHFVYAYRDFRPHGLCNQCFALGHFDRFTAAEVEYFREQFAQEGKGEP